jgi:ATP-binding cassette subfamily F protein 3
VLSGGEKSRVSLGKILLNPANILLLDEPTNHLDIESCDSMIVALDEFPGAVVIVTHSEMFLHHLANRLIVFNEDKVTVFEGTYQDFLDRVVWEEEKTRNDSATARKKQKKSITLKISQIEKSIDEAEKAFEEVNHRLVEAYSRPRDPKIQELEAESRRQQNRIDSGYEDLERFIKELDELEKNPE